MNFKSLQLGSNTSLWSKIGTITTNTFLLTRNKFDYSYRVKIHVLGFYELLGRIFCLQLVVEVFSLQKAVKMLEEVVVSWQEVRWIWWMRQNFVAEFIQFLKCWLYDVRSDIVMEKKWALSADQWQLQALQFSMHLTNLLDIILRYNGFAGIQKIVEDQMGSRPLNHVWPWPFFFFFGASLALGRALEYLVGPTTELVVI